MVGQCRAEYLTMSYMNSALTEEHDGFSLNIEKIGSNLNKELATMGLPELDLILWLGYCVFLTYQYVRQEIKWQTSGLVAFFVMIIVCHVVRSCCSPIISMLTTAFSIMLHWNHLPRATLPVNNKAVLITGCDRGIGHALARRFDRDGYKVFAGCLCAKSAEAQNLANNSVSGLVLVQMDVRDRDQVITAANTITQHLGKNNLWAVVNNAGICFIGNVEIMSMEDIDKVVAVNFLGPLHVSRTFLPILRRGRGRLINVASNAGLAPVAHMAVYCASKSALATLSESMRYELEPWGVHVSTIVPSGYRTGILAYDKKETADRWWNSASNIVKEDFGRHCFIPEFKIANHEANTTPDLSSIVDTISHAVCVKHPKPFYYSGFLAKTLPFAYTILPPFIREPVMKLIADWFIFRPNALHNDDTNTEKKST